MNTDKKVVQLISEICYRKGIRKVVFSPGSRSAPFVIAFSQITDIECIVIPDERVAGYFALGMAQQLGEPVAIVCTSGTAVLNLAPAVCEAFYQKVPLFVLTADRPKGAVQRGDNQAISQKNIFGHFATSLSLNGDAKTKEELDGIVKDTAFLIEQIQKPFCDVAHINIRLSEPLYETINKKTKPVKVPKRIFQSSPKITASNRKRIKAEFQNLKRKLIIVGCKNPDNYFLRQLSKLNKRKDLVILHESTSNLNISNTVWNTDATLSIMKDADTEKFLPDLVITLGNQIISKRIRQFLNGKPKLHWDIPVIEQLYDGRKMFGVVPDLIEPVTEREFLDILLTEAETGLSDYKSNWLSLSKSASSVASRFVSEIPFSDLKVINKLISSFPDDANIQYGNSTPVRYSNLFEHKSTQTISANRGTSGIDGCLSTAAGAAYANSKLTIAIIGDISFFYDSNALWNNYLSPDLRIVIINNGGGNIFRVIDGPTKTKDFQKFFETSHNLTAKHLASMYGLPYYICASQKELEKHLRTFFKKSAKAKILEIKTNGKISAEVYKKYFEHLRKSKE